MKHHTSPVPFRLVIAFFGFAACPIPVWSADKVEIDTFAARIVAEHVALNPSVSLDDYMKSKGIEEGVVRTAVLAKAAIAVRAAEVGLRPGSEAWMKFVGSSAPIAPVADDSIIEAAARRLGFMKASEAVAAVAAERKLLEEKFAAEIKVVEARAAGLEKKVAAAEASAAIAVNSANAASVDSAQAVQNTATARDQATVASKAAVQSKQELNKFDGLGFGTGLALTYDLGKRDRIKKATLDPARKIRVEEDTNITPRFIIETHKLFLTPKGAEKLNRQNLDNVAVESWKPDATGIFVCAEPGGDTINSIGGGFMIAWASAIDSERKVVRSFNLSLGVIVDQNVQVLGDGLKPGMVMPAGEDIRYRKTSQAGIVLMFSAGF